MSRRGKQADHRADTRGGGFVGIPVAVVTSPAYRSLTPFARALLVEVLARFNGYNNGSIAVSQRELAQALATTNFRRIGSATAELMDRGLIDVTTEGAWKQRQARQYRITFVSTGKVPHHRPAGNEYLSWKSGADHPSAATSISVDGCSAKRRKTADDLSARLAGKRRKSVDRPRLAAEHPSALIGKPYPSLFERRDGFPRDLIRDRLGDWIAAHHSADLPGALDTLTALTPALSDRSALASFIHDGEASPAMLAAVGHFLDLFDYSGDNL